MNQSLWMPFVSGALAVGRVLALAFLGYAALIFLVQRRMAFPGTSRDSPRASPSTPPGVTQVWLDASFGRVEAWFFSADGGLDVPPSSSRTETVS